MSVEVFEVGFQGWNRGEVGERRGEPQDEGTEVGDLRHEWEMAWFGWSLKSMKQLDCGGLEWQAKRVRL